MVTDGPSSSVTLSEYNNPASDSFSVSTPPLRWSRYRTIAPVRRPIASRQTPPFRNHGGQTWIDLALVVRGHMHRDHRASALDNRTAPRPSQQRYDDAASPCTRTSVYGDQKWRTGGILRPFFSRAPLLGRLLPYSVHHSTRMHFSPKSTNSRQLGNLTRIVQHPILDPANGQIGWWIPHEVRGRGQGPQQGHLYGGKCCPNCECGS